MPPALVVHPTSLSLMTLFPSSASPTPTPLALPARFPATKPPLTAAAPHGHVFVYARGYPVAWEYDARGRRIGEVVVKAASGIDAVAAFSGGVAVATGAEVRLFRKEERKYVQSGVFEAPGGTITAMGADGRLVAVCGDEVVVYDVNRDERTVLDGIETPASCVCVLRSPAAVVVPSTTGVSIVSLSGDVRDVELPWRVRDIAAGHGLLAASSDDAHGAVAVFTAECVKRTIKVGRELAGVAFLDASTLAARTTTGKLIICELTGSTTEIALDEPVLAVHALPVRPARAVSERPARTVLADSGAANVATVPRTAAFNGKAKEVGFDTDTPVSEAKLAKGDDRRAVSAPDRRSSDTRAMPTPAVPVRANGTHDAPLPTSAASASYPAPSAAAPLATPATRPTAPIPSSRASVASTVRIRPAAIDEADETVPFSPVTARTASVSSGHADAPTWEAFEEMRREIANLQLDMLRMGRGLKNEIRSAVAPLVDEVKESRAVIARQAAEIERLRRGY